MARIVDNGTGTFTECPSSKTRDLILGEGHLGTYLQAKMANFLGKPRDEVLLGTPLRIPANYANNEGVLTAMADESGFVKGLRIDLQKAHEIDGKKYATWQVQWGTGQNGKTGGAYAGALMRVDTLFGVGDLRTALEESFRTRTYWRIDP